MHLQAAVQWRDDEVADAPSERQDGRRAGAVDMLIGDGPASGSPARALQQRLERAVYADMLAGGVVEKLRGRPLNVRMVLLSTAVCWAAIIGAVIVLT